MECCIWTCGVFEWQKKKLDSANLHITTVYNREDLKIIFSAFRYESKFFIPFMVKLDLSIYHGFRDLVSSDRWVVNWVLLEKRGSSSLIVLCPLLDFSVSEVERRENKTTKCPKCRDVFLCVSLHNWQIASPTQQPTRDYTWGYKKKYRWICEKDCWKLLDFKRYRKSYELAELTFCEKKKQKTKSML